MNGGNIEPLLLKPGEAARRIGISRTQFYRWAEEGYLVPEPVTIGGVRYWRREELKAWVDAGCPERAVWRAKWEAMKTSA